MWWSETATVLHHRIESTDYCPEGSVLVLQKEYSVTNSHFFFFLQLFSVCCIDVLFVISSSPNRPPACLPLQKTLKTHFYSPPSTSSSLHQWSLDQAENSRATAAVEVVATSAPVSTDIHKFSSIIPFHFGLTLPLPLLSTLSLLTCSLLITTAATISLEAIRSSVFGTP